MVAKIFYKLFLVLIVMMASLSISAETDTAHNSTQGNGSAVLNTHHERPKDLRMPSRNFLELQYSSGMLSLFSNYYEGDFSILLVNNKNLESHTFPSMSVGESVCIELDLGEYDVKAVSKEGLELYGILEISL